MEDDDEGVGVDGNGVPVALSLASFAHAAASIAMHHPTTNTFRLPIRPPFRSRISGQLAFEAPRDGAFRFGHLHYGSVLQGQPEPPASFSVAFLQPGSLDLGALLDPAPHDGPRPLLGAAALAVVATERGEPVNALWVVVAAVSVYLIAYRYYSLFIANRVMRLDLDRPTPAVRHNDGLDYVPTNRYVLYGHHFAAIAGAGPLVGPVLAAQFGWAPGFIWLVAGVCLAGAVHDSMILWASTRRGGRSLSQIVAEEIGPVAGVGAAIAVLFIVIVTLAGLGIIVVNALEDSAWGTFTIAATIPIGIFMGFWMYVWRKGRITEATIIGVIAMLLAVVGVYGVKSYVVSRRTREFGIRLAVGAQPRALLWHMLREGSRTTTIGIGIGVLLALGAGQLLQGLLYGVKGIEPVVLVTAPLILLAASLAAGFVPALRATRVDPVVALRSD